MSFGAEKIPTPEAMAEKAMSDEQKRMSMERVEDLRAFATGESPATPEALSPQAAETRESDETAIDTVLERIQTIPQPLQDAHVNKYKTVKEKAEAEARWQSWLKSSERRRQARHVEDVKNTLYSTNPDVAKRMDDLNSKGATLLDIVDDLRAESAIRPITSTPEYRKVSLRAAEMLVARDNKDFDVEAAKERERLAA